jgi:hypothetical protein
MKQDVRRRINPEDAAFICRARLGGWTIKDIMSFVRRSEAGVKGVLHRNGIETRPGPTRAA